MAVDVEAKKQAVADIIGGKVIDDSDRVAVCIKGSVLGLPATFEAINPGWPFGVMYTVESNVVVDPNQPAAGKPAARITIYPRMGRGLTSFFTRILLFESSGMPVGDKRLEGVFNFTYDERDVALRFVGYPRVSELLMALEHSARFSELVIKTDAGIYLAQPINFNSLSLDLCQATFKTVAELAQILFEAF
jgi:hypothetical protein